MAFNSDIHKRRSIRLAGYDYSQAGLYFLTICVQDKECLFGSIENGAMILNEYGRMAEDEWLKSAKIRLEIELHGFIVMPNHIHGIVEIVEGIRRGDWQSPRFRADGATYNRNTYNPILWQTRATCQSPLRE